MQPESEEKVQLFAGRLVGARTQRTLTQTQLAELAGVSLRSIQIWESGEGNIPRPTAMRSLCVVLRVSAAWLLGRTEDPKPETVLREDGLPTRPPWADDLIARLEAVPDDKRRRVLTSIHSMLDAIIEPEPAPRPIPVKRPRPTYPPAGEPDAEMLAAAAVADRLAEEQSGLEHPVPSDQLGGTTGGTSGKTSLPTGGSGKLSSPGQKAGGPAPARPGSPGSMSTGGHRKVA
jgi:transcriptional regulator with XRE-family HTH domain